MTPYWIPISDFLKQQTTVHSNQRDKVIRNSVEKMSNRVNRCRQKENFNVHLNERGKVIRNIVEKMNNRINRRHQKENFSTEGQSVVRVCDEAKNQLIVLLRAYCASHCTKGS